MTNNDIDNIDNITISTDAEGHPWYIVSSGRHLFPVKTKDNWEWKMQRVEDLVNHYPIKDVQSVGRLERKLRNWCNETNIRFDGVDDKAYFDDKANRWIIGTTINTTIKPNHLRIITRPSIIERYYQYILPKTTAFTSHMSTVDTEIMILNHVIPSVILLFRDARGNSQDEYKYAWINPTIEYTKDDFCRQLGLGMCTTY